MNFLNFPGKDQPPLKKSGKMIGPSRVCSVFCFFVCLGFFFPFMFMARDILVFYTTQIDRFPRGLCLLMSVCCECMSALVQCLL